MNLPSRSWRAIIRRKGRYIGETFKFRDDARRWATAQESAIDKGAAPKKTHIANKTTFAHLIDLHLDDLREAGKPIGRTKLDTLLLLRRAVGHRKFAELDHKFIIDLAASVREAALAPSPSVMTAAWEHIYLRLLRPHQATKVGPLDRETHIESLTTYGGGEAQRPDVLTMEALLSQAARDPALRNMGAMIRYSRGQSSHVRLARLPRTRGPLTPQASALFSTVAQGLGRDLATEPLEQRPARARQVSRNC